LSHHRHCRKVLCHIHDVACYRSVMDAERVRLRGTLYAARTDYYRSITECYKTPEGRSVAAEGIYLDAAAAYGEALTRLLRHLTTLEQTASVIDESESTRHLIDLLDREVRSTRHFLACTRPRRPPTLGESAM
jgi:hypothetical protein